MNVGALDARLPRTPEAIVQSDARPWQRNRVPRPSATAERSDDGAPHPGRAVRPDTRCPLPWARLLPSACLPPSA
ncbi:hypothetical protein SALBM135S_02007 [Streptomyces alboniger]